MSIVKDLNLVTLSSRTGVEIRANIEVEGPDDDFHLTYCWYRSNSCSGDVYCWVHGDQIAAITCKDCERRPWLPVKRRYHCSAQCYDDYREYHQDAHSATNTTQTAAEVQKQIDGVTYTSVGSSRNYTPTLEDVGYNLMFECVLVVNGERQQSTTYRQFTSTVDPLIPPLPRQLIHFREQSQVFPGCSYTPVQQVSSFSVLSYNILGQVYCNSDVYNQSPQWCLQWTYRKLKLLEEIILYHADIVCLQEVQEDHFQDFFVPELAKVGYEALYHKRDEDIVGCATFYRRKKFITLSNQKEQFGELDSVGLIAKLTLRHNFAQICVANVQLNATLPLKDADKAPQSPVERILGALANYRRLPIVLCGDFNMTPGSNPYTLFKSRLLDVDAIIGPTSSSLQNPYLFSPVPQLLSAYSSLVRNMTYRLAIQKINMNNNEPYFTCSDGKLTKAVDYIFYSENSLAVKAVLEPPIPVGKVAKMQCIPSEELPSDHLAMLAEFSVLSGR